MLKNNPLAGFLIGAVGPVIGLFIMKLIWFMHDTVAEYVNMLRTNHDTFFKVFSLSILVNLAPFIYFNSKKAEPPARGVFVATMLYVVYIVLVRYVW